MYAPRGFLSTELGDVEVVADGEELHLFHLTLPSHDLVAHVVSRDGLAWEPRPPALRTGDPGSCDDDMIWTVSVTRHAGTWHMIYTALSLAEDGRVQRLAHATSTDLARWTKDADNPVAEADPRWYETDPAQGPWVSFRDPKPTLVDGRYHAAVCARQGSGPWLRRGAVALVTSDDLRSWRVEAPLFAPRSSFDLECPQVFRLGERWYLTASVLDDRTQRYWVADDFRGPYRTPRHNVLASPGNYAARIFRWKDRDAVLCWHEDPDDRGRVVRRVLSPMSIEVLRDGRLALSPWPEWSRWEAGPARPFPDGSPRATFDNPSAAIADGGALRVAQGMELWSCAAAAEDFSLHAGLRWTGPRAALAFGMDEHGGGWFVELDRGASEARLVRLARTTEDGRPWFVHRVVQRMPVDLDADAISVALRVVAGEVELALDGHVVLSTFVRSAPGPLGVLVECGEVTLEDGTITPMRRPDPAP